MARGRVTKSSQRVNMRPTKTVITACGEHIRGTTGALTLRLKQHHKKCSVCDERTPFIGGIVQNMSRGR
jgi:hypothetical protein